MSDGTRTRGILDHNQVLYQLSYTHHARQLDFAVSLPAEKKCTGSEGVLAHGFSRGRRSVVVRAQFAGRTCLAAIDFAVSESGPGCGTKTASR